MSPLLALLGKVVGVRASPAQGQGAQRLPDASPRPATVATGTPQIELDDFDLSFLPPADLTFALVADTHAAGRPSPEDPKAWFDLELAAAKGRNDVNNPRTAKVYAQLNGTRPSFMIHLGDLVHGHPRDGRWPTLVRRNKTLLSQLKVPAHLVPGNHDVGNKLSVPFGGRKRTGSKVHPRGIFYVSPENIEAFEDAFGPTYFHFESSGNLFLGINASVLASGLEAEAEQWRWLENQLAASRKFTNVFLAMHSLPYWCQRRAGLGQLRGG